LAVRALHFFATSALIAKASPVNSAITMQMSATRALQHFKRANFAFRHAIGVLISHVG
jgi:hypothetical protein